MKSSAPWSVKGIERDARETAKEAAKREGMTVGEWLNQIIYSAGSAEESDGEIEGLKLRDIVTAVEHLNKRIAEADAKNADAMGELTRNLGGMVERVQRLERVKPAEGTYADLAERLEKLEQAGGDRQRIDALKALEKAVAQVAAQFNTAQKTSLERLDANERQLQELAARIDRAGAGGENVSDVGFLKDAIDGLSTRIARAEKIASEAAQLKAEASGSADPQFIERTGARLRVLGDEIKRGGDQIRSLEGTISKLSAQIDAAERRSAEGVQKVADTVASIQRQVSGEGTGDISRADIDAAVSEAAQRTEERVNNLQAALDDVLARLAAAGETARSPGIHDESVAPAVAGFSIGEKTEEDHREHEATAPETKIEEPEAFDAAEDETKTIEDEISALASGQPEQAQEDKDPFAFADDIEAAFDEPAEGEADEDFSFNFDEEDETPESRGAKALLSEVEEVFGKRPPSAKAPEPQEEEAAIEPSADEDLDSILSDLENIVEPAPSEDETEEGREPAPEDARAAAKALLIGEKPAISKAPSDDAPEEDFLKAARRRAKEAAERAAAEKPTRRKLTPKQRAILAARARQKRLAASDQEAPAPTKEQRRPKAKAPEPQEPLEPSVVEDEADAPQSPLAKIKSSATGLFAKLPFIGKKNDEEDAVSAPKEKAAGDEDSGKVDGDRAAFATLKATATARPVTLALAVAIFLAVAALFFLVKDLIFKAPEAPREARPSITSTPEPAETAVAEPVTEQTPEVPAAPAIDPRELYLESMTALNAASSPDETASALESLEQAAALGHPPAQLQLGEFYKTGQGVEQDLGEARRWFRRAANGGNVLAMHRIGVMTARGEGGPADTGEAIGWFELAANRGLVDSMYNLGAIFHPSGNGGASAVQDAGKAYYWYSLAANNGDEQASPLAAGVANALTADQKQQLDEQIASWEAQSADAAANDMAPAN